MRVNKNLISSTNRKKAKQQTKFSIDTRIIEASNQRPTKAFVKLKFKLIPPNCFRKYAPSNTPNVYTHYAYVFYRFHLPFTRESGIFHHLIRSAYTHTAALDILTNSENFLHFVFSSLFLSPPLIRCFIAFQLDNQNHIKQNQAHRNYLSQNQFRPRNIPKRMFTQFRGDFHSRTFSKSP